MMVLLTKLVAFMALATASAHELRGSNQQFDILVKSEVSSGCVRETIIELTCKNGGGATSEIVDMDCDKAKAKAPGMLRNQCGNSGGRWSVKCNCAGGGSSSSISCAWFLPGTAPISCPSTLGAKYSENYTCDNGVHICCTMSPGWDSVDLTDKLNSICRRDENDGTFLAQEKSF